MFKLVRQFLCSLHGHDFLKKFHNEGAVARIYCECASCGAETPGWRVK